MRLVRILIVLIVVLSTSAWAAPTQADLPISWTQAALLTQPATAERDLRIDVGYCEPAVQEAATDACSSLVTHGNKTGCLPVQSCLHAAGRSGIQHRAPIIRGQITLSFSNAAPGLDLVSQMAIDCVAGQATVAPGLRPRASRCLG